MSPTPAQAPEPKRNRSTGPRTAAGKTASSRNAFRHGLASGSILVPGEDRAEWDLLLNGLLDEWQPATPTEHLLVGDLAKHHWLKERALRLQSEALAHAKPGELPATFPVLLRYQITNERAFSRALASLHAIQNARRQFVSQQQQHAARVQHAAAMARVTAPFPAFDPQAALEQYRAQTAARKPSELSTSRQSASQTTP